MKRIAIRLWLVVFSVGWLLPFTYSVASAYDFIRRWVWPVAAFNDRSALVPFHPFSIADKLLYVSVLWLAAVIIYWVLRATNVAKD